MDVKDSLERRESCAAPLAHSSAFSFSQTEVCPGTHWMLTVMSLLVVRMCWRLFICRLMCCPGVGCGLVHLRMAAWLSTRIRMVFVVCCLQSTA